MNNTLIWLGVRESDIDATRNLFDKSITIFGSGTNGNISMERELGKRFNHNIEMPEYDSFFVNTMDKILIDFPEALFFQYDSLDSDSFPTHLKEKIIFKNPSHLLQFLNDKITLKSWASRYTNTLPYELLTGTQILCNDLSRLDKCKEIVIQRSQSCGGEGTFLFKKSNLADIETIISTDEQYIVTEYQKNNISVNIHAVIYKENEYLFAPSIQIINNKKQRLEYIGSDYSAFNALSTNEKELIMLEATKVCAALRETGYLGVCGIDFILVNNCCYFMEVNGRFQASSALLNRDLKRQGYLSLQEYHIDAFENQTPTLPPPPKFALGSVINFYNTDVDIQKILWLKNKVYQSPDYDIIDDGFTLNRPCQSGSYVFQLHYSKAVSSITFQKTIRLHPNTMICPFNLDNTPSYDNLLRLKVLLLSRGVHIDPCVWRIIRENGGVDFEEFDAVTLKIHDKVWITAPCLECWHTLSPLELIYNGVTDNLELCYYGEVLFPVEVMKADPKAQKKTKYGHAYKDIVYMNPDRLRIYHRNGCALQDLGLGCKFCDLYGTETSFTFEEICEATSAYLDDEHVNHFLIGGGSNLQNNDCDSILRIAQYLHSQSPKNIYLMSQPIADKNILASLKNLGVTEVAFNIEMFDRSIAKEVMPGKSKNTLDVYYDSLSDCVALWGKTGNVRSIIMLGFDDISTFENGITKLCELHVSPILSLFRPCPGTPLANIMPLDELETLRYFDSAKKICDRYGIKLGPSCQACQNNTVVLDM